MGALQAFFRAISEAKLSFDERSVCAAFGQQSKMIKKEAVNSFLLFRVNPSQLKKRK
jgi:hypothetical protein